MPGNGQSGDGWSGQLATAWPPAGLNLENIADPEIFAPIRGQVIIFAANS
jgi:hypothetical protein